MAADKYQILMRLCKHLQDLERYGFVPKDWMWQIEKVKQLKDIDERLVNDLSELHALHASVPELFETVGHIILALHDDLEIMLKNPRVDLEEKERAAVNGLLKNIKDHLEENPNVKRGSVMSRLFSHFSSKKALSRELKAIAQERHYHNRLLKTLDELDGIIKKDGHLLTKEVYSVVKNICDLYRNMDHIDDFKNRLSKEAERLKTISRNPSKIREEMNSGFKKHIYLHQLDMDDLVTGPMRILENRKLNEKIRTIIDLYAKYFEYIKESVIPSLFKEAIPPIESYHHVYRTFWYLVDRTREMSSACTVAAKVRRAIKILDGQIASGYNGIQSWSEANKDPLLNSIGEVRRLTETYSCLEKYLKDIAKNIGHISKLRAQSVKIFNYRYALTGDMDKLLESLKADQQKWSEKFDLLKKFKEAYESNDQTALKQLIPIGVEGADIALGDFWKRVDMPKGYSGIRTYHIENRLYSQEPDGVKSLPPKYYARRLKKILDGGIKPSGEKSHSHQAFMGIQFMKMIFFYNKPHNMFGGDYGLICVDLSDYCVFEHDGKFGIFTTKNIPGDKLTLLVHKPKEVEYDELKYGKGIDVQSITKDEKRKFKDKASKDKYEQWYDEKFILPQNLYDLSENEYRRQMIAELKRLKVKFEYRTD